MKKKMMKSLAMMLCVMTAVAFMPTFAFAAGGASSIAVTFTVSTKGTIAKAKDGTAMVKKSVTVSDLDSDGHISYDEALTAIHKKYCTAGKAGYALTDYGTYKSVTKLWGVDTFNTLFFVNNKPIQSGVDETEVADGDNLYASVNCDDVYFADWFTAFDNEAAETTCTADVELTLMGCQGMGYPFELKSAKDIKVGIWKNGEFSPIEGAVTDENGKCTVNFKEAGTFIVSASGAVTDSVVTDWKTYATEDRDCPIMAPYCIVKVSHDNLVHEKESAGNLKNGYEYDRCTACGATDINYKKLAGWSTSYLKSFKVSKGKKAFTAKWKKQSKKNLKKFSGYQLRYSASSNMSNAKAVNVSKKSRSKTVRKLAKKKTYYVQARTYVTSNGVKYYASWSRVKSVRTK